MISSLDISAMSLAVVSCPSVSRPLQFTKCVFVMPSPAARSFICSTNASSLPLIYSAMATQASFALATAMHLINVSTVCVSPGSKNTCDPPIDAAYSDVCTSSSNAIFPSSSASKINSNVITFVTLAGARLVSASFSQITLPPAASINIAEGEAISGPDVCCSSACKVSTFAGYIRTPGNSNNIVSE